MTRRQLIDPTLIRIILHVLNRSTGNFMLLSPRLEDTVIVFVGNGVELAFVRDDVGHDGIGWVSAPICARAKKGADEDEWHPGASCARPCCVMFALGLQNSGRWHCRIRVGTWWCRYPRRVISQDNPSAPLPV